MADDSSQFPCPNCGHQRTAAHCWECDLSGTDDRTAIPELVAIAVTTAALQPFVHAIATKAGEEVWPKVAHMIRPKRRRRAVGERLADADLLRIVARDRRLTITMPKRLSADASQHLRDVIATLQEVDGRFHLSYDPASRTWDIASADDEPPED